jgi:hypothetical protein
LTRRSLFSILAILTCIHLAACAGARPKLHFDDVRYPLSMSQYLMDADGRLVEPGMLRPIAVYSYEETGWAIGYSQIQLSQLDLSGSINQAVEAAGGEAIIQLQITAKNDPCLNSNTLAFGLNMIPFYPGCSRVLVEGVIVARKNTGDEK